MRVQQRIAPGLVVMSATPEEIVALDRAHADWQREHRTILERLDHAQKALLITRMCRVFRDAAITMAMREGDRHTVRHLASSLGITTQAIYAARNRSDARARRGGSWEPSDMAGS